MNKVALKISPIMFALLLPMSTCDVTHLRSRLRTPSGRFALYTYDFNARWDFNPYLVYIGETQSATALSFFDAPFGTATPVAAFTGRKAVELQGFYSSRNTLAGGVDVVFDDSVVMVIPPNLNIKWTVQPTVGLQNYKISPDGNTGYATSSQSSSVYALDRIGGKLSYSFDLGLGAKPFGAALSPDSKRAYFTDIGKNLGYSFDTVGKSFRTFSTGRMPMRLSLTPDGTQLWIPNMLDNNITVLDTLTETVTTTIANVSNPYAVSFNPNGSRGYVLSMPTAGFSSVMVFDTSTYVPLGSAQVGVGARSMTWSPAGTNLIVANSGSGSLSILDVTNPAPRVIRNVSVGASPYAVLTVMVD